MEDATGPKHDGPESGGQIDRRKGRMATDVASLLRERISTGEMPPGERLREVQLCEEFGVSRTPVREAFRTLAAEGLVDLLPNRSVVVSKLQADDVRHLIVVFAEVEALAARLACERITDDEIKEIGRLLNEMVDCHGQRERAAYLKLNQKIHRRTIEISGNPVLLAVWQSLAPQIERARALPNLDSSRWTDALFEHSKMFTALATRDGAQLAELTRQHFLNALPYINESIAESA
ncbi:FCD domain-containing protein [Rhodobacteraceae bacterium 2CG4]|uniref:FCD domain-containing protein n=1 Tax=Halovulum marinum TaxID=2662447 RepID=A0A6L5YYD2_9RHOB|nr:GntR family transcriptional regulator [Halovulum marinum]MSU89341.1 FCD domain-containing protein [Halovulum marinum]